MELRKKLYNQFKKDMPETAGETDKAFDTDNFCDWLCKTIESLQKCIEDTIKDYIEDEEDYLKEIKELKAKVEELEEDIEHKIGVYSELCERHADLKQENTELKEKLNRAYDFIEMVYKSVLGGGDVVTFQEIRIREMEGLLTNKTK